MKNTLSDLNNYLFEALERLTDDSLSEEDLQKEITRCNTMTSVAETIIHNGELSLKAMKHAEEYGLGSGKRDDKKLPPMLEMQ